MTQKKLFTVTIETEIVVVASDNDEAEKVAKEAFRSRDIGSEEYDFRPREMKFLPSGWDLNAIPFGEREASDPDRTIQGWIDAGAGVFYLEERERLRKVRESFRESLGTAQVWLQVVDAEQFRHQSTEELTEESPDSELVRTWSTSIVSLGSDKYRLLFPLIISLEDYGVEIIASWPEVEAWGTGNTDSEAINALKDDIVRLCDDLLGAQDLTLGKLPRRWAMALRAVIAVVVDDAAGPK